MEPEARRRLRSLLDTISDDELRALAPAGAPSTGSWGASGPIEVGGSTLFAKRIPVTVLEAERWPSTANHFGLPLRYQYGVGSAGFGAAREASTWEQASGWVDDGRTHGFTSLLHQRLLPREGAAWTIPLGRDDYVARWDGDARIARFVEARADATHELWLVGEHLPHTAMAWLTGHQDRVDDLVAGVLAAVAVLREHELAHFDAHLGNVVVDEAGERFCLVDFGLASSPDLDLDAEERRFLAAHRHFDVGEVLFSLSLVLGIAYRTLETSARERALRACEVSDPDDRIGLLSGLIDHADRLADEGLVDLHAAYVAALERYREVILYVDAVFAEASLAAPSVRYDDAEMVARLVSCGVSSSA